MGRSRLSHDSGQMKRHWRGTGLQALSIKRCRVLSIIGHLRHRVQTPHGSLRPLNLALFWPYHAALRTKLGLQRQLSSEPAWNRVTPDYYIGAW